MDEFGSILTLAENERQVLRFYGLVLIITLLFCFVSKSRIIALSGGIVAAGWLVSVTIYLMFRAQAGPLLALQGTSIALIFFWLWRRAKENNAPLYRQLFWLHTAYAAAAGYRAIGEIWFPESLSSTYYLQQFIQNRLFDLTLLYLMFVSGVRIWLRRKTYFPARSSAQNQDRDIRNLQLPRLLKNIIIEISNDGKPENERTPLERPDDVTETGLTRQPVSKDR